MSAEVVVICGPLLGERFAVGQGSLTLGRSPSSTVHLAIPEAAWEHCSIQPEGDGHILIDHHTGHGTYINGLRITRQSLEDGDQISIGDAVLLYRIHATGEVPQSIQTVL